ncbi:MAG: hypothetical protein ACLP50_14260 [Solirubrobacteraceae bacterium]
MSSYRFDIDAAAGPATQQLTDGHPRLLVRVRMFDDGSEHPQPDVLCDLAPADARQLAIALLASAEHADRLSSARSSAGIHASGRPPHAGSHQPPKQETQQQS